MGSVCVNLLKTSKIRRGAVALFSSTAKRRCWSESGISSLISWTYPPCHGHAKGDVQTLVMRAFFLSLQAVASQWREWWNHECTSTEVLNVQSMRVLSCSTACWHHNMFSFSSWPASAGNSLAWGCLVGPCFNFAIVFAVHVSPISKMLSNVKCQFLEV